MSKILIIALFIAFVFWMVAQQGRDNKAFLAGAKRVQGIVTAKDQRPSRLDQPTRKENWLV